MTSLLASWPFDPSRINARFITDEGGKRKVQLRLDLGIMQMELDGRPDGTRPEDEESWFEYYQGKLEAHRSLHESEDGFQLNAEDCSRLHHEAVQYYHRYLSLFQLEDWTRVIRDTQRNLSVFEFVSRYAQHEDLAWMLRQFTPYVLMMHSRAKAMLSISKSDFSGALRHVDKAIAKITAFLTNHGADEMLDSSPELTFLKSWQTDLKKQVPVSPEEKIERDLQEAIRLEEYEKAAALRDQLLALQSTRPR